MPEPHRGEPLNKFIGRYVSSKEATKSFPKKKQRLAVAYSEAKEAHLKKR
jgi:hypothetical protein